MRAPRILLFLPLVFAPALHSAEIVLTDPDYGKINSSGIDQPRLYALVSDPAQDNQFITWTNPISGEIEPIMLTAFIDTGASGFAISHLHATGDYDQPAFGLSTETPGDYLGAFTETGIGGVELGDVSRPLGIWVRNGPIGASEEIPSSEFAPFGDFSLWVRRETGTGEVVDFAGTPSADPINLIGMPVIRQRRLHLDVRPMQTITDLGVPQALITELLPPGAPEPITQATVPLVLRDFIGAIPPPGEVLPSHYANPLVPGLTLSHGSSSATGEWLLDTGAGSSFASFATARAAGLIPAHYASLSEFMADYEGPTADIGGIGAPLTVPVLTVDRISVPTREGATLVWENVDLLIADVAGLDGIFGMNLFVPALSLNGLDLQNFAATLAALQAGDTSVDLGAFLALLVALSDTAPAAFSTVVIDTTDTADPVMRLGTSAATGTVFAWLGDNFTAAERSLPTVGSLAADADSDGFSNLLEYALGLDPRAADPASSAAPHASTPLVAGARHLALTFTRPVGGRPDVNYVVEISNDLASWRRDTGEVVTHATETVGERETLTLRTASSLTPGGRVFLRLRVSLEG